MTDAICRCGATIAQPRRGKRRSFCGQCPCGHTGCGRVGNHAGFCKYHYERARVSKSLVLCRCGKGHAEAKGLCGRCYSQQYQRRLYKATCVNCGKSVTKRQRRGEFCSASCARSYLSTRRQSSGGDPRWREAKCAVCSKAFFTAVQNCASCSVECKTRLDARIRDRARAVRRIREVAAYVEDVDRHKVFAADGYHCHLCGDLTDRTKAAPHPKSPTIDHVIPLAQGGKHEMANVRTACFACNSIKGDRGGGEQFALVF